MTKLSKRQVIQLLSEDYDAAKENLDKATLDKTLDYNALKKEAADALQKLTDKREELARDLAEKETDTQQRIISGATPKERETIAFGKALQSMAKGERADSDVRQALNISDSSTGGFYLPDNLAKKIVSEPASENPFNSVFSTTVNEQRVPILTVTSDDKAFIQDGETAKEILASAGSKRFDNNIIKLFVDVTSTTLDQSDVGNLEGEIVDKLREALNLKFYDVLVNATPTIGEKHMSLLANTDLVNYEGEDLVKAIKKAKFAFKQSIRNKLAVAVSEEVYDAYVDARTIATGIDWSLKSPEKVLGVSKVVFADEFAEKFLVFVPSFGRYNLNSAPFIEKDKAVKTGIVTYVITADFDFQVLLTTMFKTATIVTTP